ncbi:MAG: PDZ domain-containing protein, partial [Gemmatimonadales bacterium]
NWDAERFSDSTRIAVFPSAWRGSRWWQYSQVQNLEGILRALKHEYNVDENRVYVIGVSDGGIGTYFLGFRDPDPWAALLPFIASPEALTNDDIRADGPVYVPNLRNVPLYIVNGSLDPLYPARAVAADVALFREAGVDVTFRPQPESGHDLRWWQSESPAIEEFIRDHVRDPLPDTLTWETERTDRYARAFWVIVNEIGPVTGGHEFPPFDSIQPLPPTPSLGVRADPTSSAGVRILSVELGSLGAVAGFVEGDVITTVNGTPTPTVRALMEATAGASWGDTLRITARRPGLIRTLLVAIPEAQGSVRPPERVVFDRPEPTGRIHVTRHDNTITVLSRNVRRYTLLLSPDQFDLSRPIRVTTNGRVSHDAVVQPDVATLLKWYSTDQDRTMLFAAELQVDVSAVAPPG